MAEDRAWWTARFRLAWPCAEPEPQFYLDLVIAHRIVAPVLKAYNLVAWRFHRRAGRDAAGHQFRFLFYSSRNTADAIFRMIGTTSLLQEMKEAGLIIGEWYDDPPQPQFEGAGDQTWPSAIQKVWPYDIHKVSPM